MTRKNTSFGAKHGRLHSILFTIVLAAALFAGGGYATRDFAIAADLAVDAGIEAAAAPGTKAAKITAEVDAVALRAEMDAAARAADVEAVIAAAMAQNGAPYVYGGTTPRGFDCSGFVMHCMREGVGIEMPRTAASQSRLGSSVPMSELERGDLLYWGSGAGVYHVGIYIGDGEYIHAAGRGKGVRVQSMGYNPPSFAKKVL